MDTVLCFAGNGMVESFLEPYLKDYAGATQTQIGLVFLCLGAAYMLTTIPTGAVS